MSRQPRKLAGIGSSEFPNLAAIQDYVGPNREVIHDGLTLRPQDGSTPGGHPLALAGQNADIEALRGPNDGGAEIYLGESTMPSAATTDIGAINTVRVAITGSATISNFGGQARRFRFLTFLGVAKLIHNAASLVLPNGGKDIVTAPGDSCIATSDSSGGWRVRNYQRADGTSLQPLVRRRNRIINPGFWINQEKGFVPQAIAAAAGGIYVADQWLFNNSAGAAFSVQAVPGASPGGSTARMRATVTAGAATVPNASSSGFLQRIEGVNWSDLQWGTALARPIVLRFGFKGPAGNYGVSIRNGGSATRSYTAPFTITPAQANTDTVQAILVPGDTSGTWETGQVAGASFGVFFAVSTDQRGAPGAWTAGNFIAPSVMDNNADVAGKVFELFDVDVYEGTVVRPFVMPAYNDDLIDCQRYWIRQLFRASFTLTSASTNAYLGAQQLFPTRMRAAPTITYTDNDGNPSRFGIANVGTNIAPSIGAFYGDSAYFICDFIFSANYYAWGQATVTANARM